MSKAIEINKNTDRLELDKGLLKLLKQRKSIDLGKYFGKVDFGVGGLEYQLKIRKEWR